jgi:rhodanese-related sulfurtransferase
MFAHTFPHQRTATHSLAAAGAILVWSFNMPLAHGADPVKPALANSRDLVAYANKDVEYRTAAELKKRIQANHKLVLLDVRTQEEFEAGHLKGATWIERGILEFMLLRQLPDPDAEIIIYCKSANRTALAVKSLKEAGYRNVSGLQGGFDDWAKQGNSFYNYLGELKLIVLTPRDASDPALDFYRDKTITD